MGAKFRKSRGKDPVVSQSQFCRFCYGTGWVDVRVEPVGGEDMGPVDQDADSCLLCNPDGSTQDYFDLPDEIKEKIPYYWAQAVGGFDGQYGHFQQFNEHGQLIQSVIIDRSLINYMSWQPPQAIDSCPVCHGWGVWSDNGHIYDCIACGGHPIESRHGFEPLHAWWVNWQIGHSAGGYIHLYTPRGNAYLEILAKERNACRRDSTQGMLNILESAPGIVRVQ